MKIFCPTCDTSIEVSKFLVGQKGRCPTCATKFLIPESPDDEMEILEQGEIPEGYTPPASEPVEEEPKPKAKAKSKKKSSSASRSKEKAKSSGAKRASAATGGARRVMPATGAPKRSAAKPVVVKQSSGAFGFLFAIVLAALVGIVVYVMMERQKVQQLAAEQANNKVEEPAKAPVEAKPKPVPKPIAPVEPMDDPGADAIPVFAKVIKPVLEAKCVKCHGGEKIKARLEMDTYEKLIAGGGNGSIVTPDADDPNRTEMIFRAELPEADDEHMPPADKPQLTPDELAIIKWWIKEGAHEKMESTEAPEDIRKKIKELAKL